MPPKSFKYRRHRKDYFKISRFCNLFTYSFIVCVCVIFPLTWNEERLKLSYKSFTQHIHFRQNDVSFTGLRFQNNIGDLPCFFVAISGDQRLII